VKYIFLDLLFERDNSQYAKQIIQLIQKGVHEGYVADITLLNIDYIAKKQGQEIRKFLYFIERYFVIIGADNKDMLIALKLGNSDLEDNVQAILAKKSTCDLIVSNDKNFIQNSLSVLGAELFLTQYPSK